MSYKRNPWLISLSLLLLAVAVTGVFFFKSKPQTTDCSRHGTDWTNSSVAEFSFCYRTAWGEPEASTVAEGSLFRIRFANNVLQDSNKGDSTPSVWWEHDYRPESVDYALTCFECIDFTKPANEITNAMGYGKKNATSQKTIIDGKNALRVHENYIEAMFNQGKIDRINYFIPNAFNNYDFQVSMGADHEAELDTFVQSLGFK